MAPTHGSVLEIATGISMLGMGTVSNFLKGQVFLNVRLRLTVLLVSTVLAFAGVFSLSLIPLLLWRVVSQLTF